MCFCPGNFSAIEAGPFFLRAKAVVVFDDLNSCIDMCNTISAVPAAALSGRYIEAMPIIDTVFLVIDHQLAMTRRSCIWFRATGAENLAPIFAGDRQIVCCFSGCGSIDLQHERKSNKTHEENAQTGKAKQLLHCFAFHKKLPFSLSGPIKCAEGLTRPGCIPIASTYVRTCCMDKCPYGLWKSTRL